MPREPGKGCAVEVAVLDLLCLRTLCYNPRVSFGDQCMNGNKFEDFYSPRETPGTQIVGSVVEGASPGKLASLKKSDLLDMAMVMLSSVLARMLSTVAHRAAGRADRGG
jgi:hypothetical protein